MTDHYTNPPEERFDSQGGSRDQEDVDEALVEEQIRALGLPGLELAAGLYVSRAKDLALENLISRCRAEIAQRKSLADEDARRLAAVDRRVNPPARKKRSDTGRTHARRAS